MAKPTRRVVVTGLGIVSSHGRGVAGFVRALRDGRSGIGWLRRQPAGNCGQTWAGAEIATEIWHRALEQFLPEHSEVARRFRSVLRPAPFGVRMSVLAAVDAWLDACIERVPRAGVIFAGSNVNPAYVVETAAEMARAGGFVNPRYAFQHYDTNALSCTSEILRLEPVFGWTAGAASASGNTAILQGFRAIQANQCDVCLVAGSLTELSEVELRSFASLGAMACGGQDCAPETLCRPFDNHRAGFVYGQASAAMVLEREEHAASRGAARHGLIAGAAMALDGTALPEPSTKGESRAMEAALGDGCAPFGLDRDCVGYLNAHATASRRGDETELAAIETVFGTQAERLRVNSTKSITGHCLSSAGIVEAISTLVQINDNFCHPNLNLVEPIASSVRLIGSKAEPLETDYALSNSFGFGGINSCIMLGSKRVAA